MGHVYGLGGGHTILSSFVPRVMAALPAPGRLGPTVSTAAPALWFSPDSPEWNFTPEVGCLRSSRLASPRR